MSYQSEYSGAQVDEAVGKALNPDATPTEGSTNLVESGGVYGLVSNRNLLDNPWFRVNQRGATSGTGIAYIADRWFTSFGSGGVTWSRTDDTVTIQSTSGSSNAYIIQVIEQDVWSFLNGNTVTVSVMLNDYSIIHNTFVWNSESNQNLLIGKGLDDKEVRLETNVSQRRFAVRKTQTAETFRAVKLELGSVSTLANDVAPNYAEELAKCQYYFYRLKAGEPLYGSRSIGAANYSSFRVPVIMRATPTATKNGGTITICGQNGTQYGFSSFNNGTIDYNAIGVYLTQSASYAGEKLIIFNAGGTIDLSADL